MPPAEDLDRLAQEAEELDGYFSDAPLDPKPLYPPLRKTFETSVVITNLPKVPQAKFEKLTNVVVKLTTKIGSLVTDEATQFNGVFMPFDEEKDSSLGFCIVEFATPEDAEKAVTVLQGYSFDKKHQLSVLSYPRCQELKGLDTAAEFVAPTPAPFEEKPNVAEWLEDPHQRDAFVLRFQNETVVNWFDHKSDPVVDYDGSREKEQGVAWCQYYCHWSPAGSYLATLVPDKGVILWGGKGYDKIGRFVAPGVKRVVFSPQENYLLTNNEDPSDPAAIKVYHIATGNLLRAFSLFPEKEARDQMPPPFLWSFDDKYLARMGQDLITIYESPSMRLLDSRSLACDGIKEFQWSPVANVIAYWAPEANNAPAHVDLIEIPSRQKLRQKNLFNVSKCNMVFSPTGDYLAVKVTRHTKSKKTFYNNIELFRLSQPGIPVEMLDIQDAVMALTWEPNGSRFAMIHAENPTASKVQVSFYDMMKKPDALPATGVVGAKQLKKAPQAKVPELNKIETLHGKQCNYLFWSPAGSTIIMASLGDSASGSIEFYDVDSKTLVVKEHYRANQVLWDPSGRTVATCVTQPLEGGHFKFAMDNGYILWSFQGKQLYQESFETFYEFEWRPREKLLSKKDIKKVRQNLKTYEKQFDKADRRRERTRYLEETAGKRAERAKIRAVLDRNRTMLRRQRDKHLALLQGYDSEDENNYVFVELTVEKILSSKEEVVM
ncbi:translation initiation factor 3 subunit B [Fistulifera solaris]|uniref:Eukaryotic translation initiation factor 3 subunit B n=1 Tax=Fistulifera solaris TaxID=1519565 RepID=A0A1Z5KKU3_FISSO|nr:translation initiation factor 3 subunit B [Fistulifera solaris]|eukprot:GAX26940.1 translation initiation factor 3 subunit B [Fistulifera solaris]